MTIWRRKLSYSYQIIVLFYLKYGNSISYDNFLYFTGYRNILGSYRLGSQLVFLVLFVLAFLVMFRFVFLLFFVWWKLSLIILFVMCCVFPEDSLFNLYSGHWFYSSLDSLMSCDFVVFVYFQSCWYDIL